MPICDISFPEDLLSKAEQDKIAERITQLLLDAEGLSDNAMSRSICLVDFNESNKMYLGGELLGKGKIIVKIHVFYDAYSNSIKEKLHSDITKIFIEENRVTHELEGNNIWSLIIPVQSYDFGVGGRTVTLDLTRKVVSSYNR